nr:hypothetical protein [Tanacetum cinerariifolium]
MILRIFSDLLCSSVRLDTSYWILILGGLFVKCRHGYAVSSLMDTTAFLNIKKYSRKLVEIVRNNKFCSVRAVIVRILAWQTLRHVIEESFEVRRVVVWWDTQTCRCDVSNVAPKTPTTCCRGGLLAGIHGLFNRRYCGLVRWVTYGYLWPGLEGNYRDFGMIRERLRRLLDFVDVFGYFHDTLAMPSYFHKKFCWGTVFATRRRSFIKPWTGLRMKRKNCRTRVLISLYPYHIEEKMTIKEVRGESVIEWKTKVTTKERIVIKLPGKFRGYKLSMKEEVEENEGLKKFGNRWRIMDVPTRLSLLVTLKSLMEKRVRYAASCFVNKALTWWNTQVQARGRKAAIGMSWNDFKALLVEEFCLSNEMEKLENEFWKHTMVGANRVAYTVSAILTVGILTDEAVRCGKLTKGNGKRKEMEESKNAPCKLCYNCQKPSHYARQCWALIRQVALVNVVKIGQKQRACYECRSLDHLCYDCPKWKQATGQARNPLALEGNRNTQNNRNQARGREFNRNSVGSSGPKVVTGTFSLNNQFTTVLFDSRADFSFISSKFVPLLNVEPCIINPGYVIGIAEGESVEVDRVIRDCKLELRNSLFTIDLIPLGHESFDVIVGMDWLSKNKAVIVVVRATTTATSLEAEQKSGNIYKLDLRQHLMNHLLRELVHVVDLGAKLPHWGMQMLKLDCSRLGDQKSAKESQKIGKEAKGKNFRNESLQDCDFDDEFDDIDDMVDKAIENVEGDTFNATIGVSAASALVTTAGVSISTAEPRTPPITTTKAFKDEDLTIAQTLIKMRKLALRLHEEEKAELKRMQRDKSAQKEASNAALTAEFDDVQARIDADALLAAKIQEKEREQFSIDEQARFLVKIIAKRKRFFTAQRAEQIRNKPPTKAQLRNKMITYLKNMGSFTYNQLKNKSL